MRRCEFCDSPVSADAVICPVCREDIAEETLERILPILRRPETPEVRALGTIDRIWGTIRRPAPTYRDIGQRPDFVGPFAVIIMNALIMAGVFLTISSKITRTVYTNVTLRTTAEVSILSQPDGLDYILTALVSILPNIAIGMVYLIIGSAFAHLAMKVTGGTGNKGKTISIVGYSMIPVLIFRLVGLLVLSLALPTYYLQGPLDPGGLTQIAIVDAVYTSSIWITLDYLMLISFVWVGFLLIFGIREAHDASTAWAILVSIACVMVLMWTFIQVH
ncbi:MAG: YIP1 family protein [Candidatus Thorarchaeota archaeon]|nr:YIP1 family protein [Candidatus Thorarchaeota archaeon]